MSVEQKKFCFIWGVELKKIIRVFLVAITVLSVLTLSVVAHSGRTDANGGHYNRSTGEYHYHHGYPAHQHPGGYCPYTDDDYDNPPPPPVSFGDLDDETSSVSQPWYNSPHSESVSSYSYNSSKADDSTSELSSKESSSDSDSNILSFILENLVWIWIIPWLIYKLIIFVYRKIKNALSK